MSNLDATKSFSDELETSGKIASLWTARTPNQSGTFKAGPRYLVMHYTAGASAESSASWLRNPEAKASAHFVIGDGLEYTQQLLEIDRIAWHAGRSYYNGESGFNHFSIGLEFDNPGILQQRPGGGWVTSYGKPVTSDKIIVAPHDKGGPVKGWHRYSEGQIRTGLMLVKAILKASPSIKAIVGHDDIAWPRKTDPGPAFPMHRFQALLDTRSESDPRQFTVRVQALNMRGGPGVGYPKLDSSPTLAEGTVVEELGTVGDWMHIRLTRSPKIEGYVYASYLDLL